MMEISKVDVRKLAKLARLEISDAQASEMAPQLENILDFVTKLSELDTSGIEPMTTALDVENRWRPDVAVAVLDRSAALANAPSADDECFRVPPVLG